MKNFFLTLLAVVLVAGITSCGGSAPKANLKSTQDSLSYALGVIQSAQMGFDRAFQENADKIVPGATINLEEFIAGLYDYSKGDSATSKMTPEEAGKLLDAYVERYNNAKADSAIQAGVKFMVENAKNDSVKTIDVTYKDQEGKDAVAQMQIKKIIENAEGAQINDSSTVTLAYKGCLTDGTTFDSNDSVTWNLKTMSLVPGFTNGLLNMKMGEKAVVVFPCELGYGKQANPRSPIPGGSVLQFEITIKDVK